jgi:tetratricopeptide (TPR) repeat protein
MIKALMFIVMLIISATLSAQEIDLLILNNEYDKALQMINRELAKDPNKPDVLLKKGIIQQKQFDFAGAIISLERAWRIDSLNPNILVEIAEANASLGNYQSSLPYLKTLYYHDTTSLVKALKLVRGYFNLRMYKEPYQILKIAYQRDSSNLIVNKQFALCATRTGNSDLAISLYNKVIQVNPTDLANYLNLASIYQNRLKDNNVIQTLENGLEFFPEEPQLLIRLGDFQFRLKKYKKAIIPYEKYLASGDSVPVVMKNIGICYFFNNRAKEGLYLLEKSLKAVPNDAIAAFYVGLCYKELGNLKKSLEYLNFAAEIAIPGYLTDIYHHLGYVYKLNRNYMKAITALKKSHELDPDKCDIFVEIAENYEKIPNGKSLAVKYYNDYIKTVKGKDSVPDKLSEYAEQRIKSLKIIK